MQPSSARHNEKWRQLPNEHAQQPADVQYRQPSSTRTTTMATVGWRGKILSAPWQEERDSVHVDSIKSTAANVRTQEQRTTRDEGAFRTWGMQRRVPRQSQLAGSAGPRRDQSATTARPAPSTFLVTDRPPRRPGALEAMHHPCDDWTRTSLDVMHMYSRYMIMAVGRRKKGDSTLGQRKK